MRRLASGPRRREDAFMYALHIRMYVLYAPLQDRAVVWLAVSLLGLGCGDAAARRGWECIAPANPGGGWDLTCRAVGAALGELRIAPGSVRVTNMPGAGGGVAFAHTVTLRQNDSGLIVAASPSTTLRLAQGQYGGVTGGGVRGGGGLGAGDGGLGGGR